MGVVGSVIGGITGSNAASSAAGQQASAANAAAAQQAQQQAFTNARLAPFIGEGTNAAGVLGNLTGANGPDSQKIALSQNGLSSLQFQPTQEQLAATPGYQWNLAQGQQATANSNAAQGRGVSGAALKGAANFATGLANNTLMSQDQIFQNNLGNVLNPLQNLTSTGVQAAGTGASSGQASSANIGQDIVGAGNAQASGTIGSNNAINGISSGINNNLLYNSLLNGGGAGIAPGLATGLGSLITAL